MSNQLELVLDLKADLAEGPFWDDIHQKLYWVDINNKRVNIYDPLSESNRVIQLDQYVGAVIPTEKGDVLVTLQDGIYRLNLETEELTKANDLEVDQPDNRFNDCKCDPLGRLWAGSMPLRGMRPNGALYRVDSDFSVVPQLSDIACSNGMAWDLEKKHMYYIDTPTRKIDVLDFDAEAGEISNRRTLLEIPTEWGMPDGMTIDSEGMIWVALWGGWRVVSWNPETGEKLTEIKLPVSNVTSCVFGGENLDELYITTAREHLSEEDLKAQPLAGGVFRVRVDVKGTPSDRFKG